MSNVISIENLGKKYLLSHRSERGSYVALRDVLADGARQLGRRLLGRSGAAGARQPQEEFWALQELNFEVQQGDRIGIIGRNGAGKSTLLKILSRITEPTTGSVRIRGRVASLLEVGTGFHPELTGRENIFLNGAIMGMSRVEIARKFDQIVDFAEIERFLDTPVKRYSSGMYVRLAFAVAAFLEPEVLIVDEVLAVGDAQFQKKCLGRMKEVGREGRTVLFVSHNMDFIKLLCSSGILLHGGRNLYSGEVDSAIAKYESLMTDSVYVGDRGSDVVYQNEAVNSDAFDIIQVKICDKKDQPISQVNTFDSFKFRVKFHSPDCYESKSAALFVSNLNRRPLLRLAMYPYSPFTMHCKKGTNEFICQLEKIPLPAGTYLLIFGICESQTGEWLFERDLCPFEIGTTDIYQSGVPPTDKLCVAVSDYFWTGV